MKNIRISFRHLSELSIERLEQIIDGLYEAEAAQATLDRLEVLYAQRVSEAELDICEAELGLPDEISPWLNLEEMLAELYHRHETYQPSSEFTKADVIRRMRTRIEISGGLSDGFSDMQILDASRDCYNSLINLCRKLNEPKSPVGLDAMAYTKR